MQAVLETCLIVRCRYCEKPIRVSGAVAKKASHDTSDTEHWQLSSQVFVLRCRSCEKESVYSLKQVVNIPARPPRDAHVQ
jgi:hypothetical protein